MDIHDVLEEERVHLSSGRSTWGLMCYEGVHGDERRMLRIMSPPLGKIRPLIVILITMETIVMDGLEVGRS